MNAETAVNDMEATVTPTEQQVATQETKENLLTQDDVNRIVADRVAREKAKFEKKFSNVDIDHYKTLVEKEELQAQEQSEKRGEYEKLLKEQADKFNGKLTQYQTELHTIKVDGTLLNEASAQKAINPQQVVSLLKDQVKLNDGGGVDVVDSSGQGIGKQTPVVDNDISKLDMSNPNHRAQYAEIMKGKGIRL